MYRQKVIYVLEFGFTLPKNTRILLLFKFKIYAKLLTFTSSFLFSSAILINRIMLTIWKDAPIIINTFECIYKEIFYGQK